MGIVVSAIGIESLVSQRMRHMTENTPTEEEINPNILGQLTSEEWNSVVTLNNQHAQLLKQVGVLEMRKFKAMAALDGSERALQDHMTKIRTRLRIPAEVAWNVQGNGDGNGYALIQQDPRLAAQAQEPPPNE